MTGSGSALTAITKPLMHQWQATKADWSDAKAAEFEAKYLVEMFSAVDKAVAVMEELDKLVKKIRTDCE